VKGKDEHAYVDEVGDVVVVLNRFKGGSDVGSASSVVRSAIDSRPRLCKMEEPPTTVVTSARMVVALFKLCVATATLPAASCSSS
jgi:hypothetical protein